MRSTVDSLLMLELLPDAVIDTPLQDSMGLLAVAIGIGRHKPNLLEFMRQYPDIRALSRISVAELKDAGFSELEIERWAAFFGAARHFAEVPFVPGKRFDGAKSVYEHFRERLAAARREYFILLLLDNKHQLVREHVVSVGTLTATLVHPREVFTPIIRESVAAFVMVHNHPSGDPVPSREDLEITRRIREVADIMGVRALDHVVIGAGRYVSFIDDGYW